MWRIGQFVLDSLFRETDQANFLSKKDANLQKQALEAYRISIKRGLTPRDALVVASACCKADKSSLWAPDLAKRSVRTASH